MKSNYVLVGCQTVLGVIRRILDSQLIQHCVSPPWPEVRRRLDYLSKWFLQQIIGTNKQKIRNVKATENRSLREDLIGTNNFSFANSLTMKVVNQKVIGKIDKKYRAAASAFQSLGEFEYLPLHEFEPNERRSRFKYYEALIAKSPGAHFGRPYIMMMRENESDLRYIRYIVAIPNEMNMTDSAVLRKIEIIKKEISNNIACEALTYMKNDIEDVLASTIEGHGIQSVTKKLQNILNKRKTNEIRIENDLASNILSGGQVSSSVILDICAVAEKRSRFDFFFKLCHDLCRKRVSGALAKRHGIVEEVEHVTSIAELWRLVSHQVEEHFTDENSVIDVDEVARNIPSYDYLTKQLSPKNEYIRKSERFYSSLQFKLAMSGRSNHVKHPDFNYTQVM